MNEMHLTQDDLHNVVRSLPGVIRTVVTDGRAILAGGYIREIVAGRNPSDIDLFVSPIVDNVDFMSSPVDPAENLASSIVTTLTLPDKRFPDHPPRKVIKFKTNNAITLLTRNMLPIQIITRWRFNSPLEVISSFDFTICRAAVFCNNAGKVDSIVDFNFYSDLAANRLRYTAPERIEEVGGSIVRMKKFMTRGYRTDLLSMARLMARVFSGFNRGDLMDRLGHRGFGDIEGGEEGWYTQVILGLMREVDPSISFSALGIETEEDELVREGQMDLNE